VVVVFVVTCRIVQSKPELILASKTGLCLSLAWVRLNTEGLTRGEELD
jgi:hypothetical protein